MVKVITSPRERFKKEGDCFIFLAGSIDNGQAVNWQTEYATHLKKEGEDNSLPIYVLNPRREDWNPNIDPSQPTNYLTEQIDWELRAMESSDIIIFFFAKDSKSPISMLELGLNLSKNKEKLIVICEPGFYRRTNIVETCDHYGVKVYSNFLDIERVLNEQLENMYEW
jgi:hypothetical protein